MNLRRIRFGIVLGTLICVCTLGLSWTRAGIIVQDDFNGTAGSAPDTSKWSSSPGTDYPGIPGFTVPTLDGSGHVALDSTIPANTPDIVAAKPSFMTAATT